MERIGRGGQGRITPGVSGLAAGLALAFAGCTGGEARVELATSTTLAPTSTTLAPTSTTLAPTSTTLAPTSTTLAPTSTTVVSSDELVLSRIGDLTGDLASKSVVASGQGLFFAQNMMYRHTISVFDRDQNLVATIPDTVDLSLFGIDVEPGEYRGAPVEAAFGPDGRYGYVSNYRMYGPGFGSTAGDDCGRGEGQNSFVYRIDTKLIGSSNSPIDEVYEVGSVPKFLVVTPDNKYLLVTNWCSFDMSVVDLASGDLVGSVPLGRHPRGIVVSSDSQTAYATVMGGSDIAVVNLGDFQTTWIRGVGPAPRHLVLSPDDRTLYATLNGAGAVVKIDLASGEVIATVRTGAAPRTMAIADDGRTLYVVNYESNTMTSVRSSDFEILQTLKTADKPIGVTFDPESREVWVATYSGVIHVYEQTQSSQVANP